MKRGTAILEPWSTKEKLCLSSAVLRSGDQNWMSVSRLLRVFGEQDRPSEWYSQKQCALQYEALLNNAGTSKRKKRSEKGVETVDTPSESIARKLLQERLEELTCLLEEDKREYMRIKKEKEDIESGKADDRLDEFEREIEEEEREATRGSILRQHEERSRLEGGRLTTHSDSSVEQAETKVPTSPLLTSLLQSPSHYRGASIHNLLNPPPPLSRLNDSPTLSRLLEFPAKQLEPTALFQSPVKKEPVEEDQPVQSTEKPSPASRGSLVEVEEARLEDPSLEKIKTEAPDDNEELNHASAGEATEIESTDEITGLQMQEVVVEISGVDEAKAGLVHPNKVEPEEQDGEKEEPEHSSLNNLQDSDTMEEQQSITELDSQTVNMIVAGGGVISVSHDTSSEHLEEVTSSDIQHKDDSDAAESVKEDSLDDVSDEINETMKEVDSTVSGNIEADSTHTVEVEALNNFIIGPETPKNNYVVQVLCSTPENVLEEETRTPEVKTVPNADNSNSEEKTNEGEAVCEEINMEGAVLEVKGEMVNLGGAVTVVVEEEVDTTVHEVEVLVSELDTTPRSEKCLEEEDSTQDGEIKELAETPDTGPHEESQEEDEVFTPKTSSNEDNEKEDKDEDNTSHRGNSSSFYIQSSLRNIESKPDSPSTVEDDEGGAKSLTKKRLISGSVCSDSKPSSPACHLLDNSKDLRPWKKSIMQVYNSMATHKYASIFLKPITNEQAPAYDTVIHRPVDLFTIKKRIEAGELRTTVEFQRDLLLMFQNAIMYNNCRTLVYEMASVMQNECMPHIELMVEAMGEGVPWRKDPVNVDKLHTRGRGEAPKRKRASVEDSKSVATPKRRKEAST